MTAALTAGQRRRLSAALSPLTDTSFHLNVVLDPWVGGGMAVQVGEERPVCGT